MEKKKKKEGCKHYSRARHEGVGVCLLLLFVNLSSTLRTVCFSLEKGYISC